MPGGGAALRLNVARPLRSRALSRAWATQGRSTPGSDPASGGSPPGTWTTGEGWLPRIAHGTDCWPARTCLATAPPQRLDLTLSAYSKESCAGEVGGHLTPALHLRATASPADKPRASFELSARQVQAHVKWPSWLKPARAPARCRAVVPRPLVAGLPASVRRLCPHMPHPGTLSGRR
jgi:hypothetical protein